MNTTGINKKSPQQAAGYWGSKAADPKHAASCGEYIPKGIYDLRRLDIQAAKDPDTAPDEVEQWNSVRRKDSGST